MTQHSIHVVYNDFMRNIKHLLFLCLALSSCAPISSTSSTGEIDLKSFHAGVDGSVSCPSYPNQLSDIGISVDSSNVMTVISNQNNRPAIFINSIAGLENNPWQPNSLYTLSGEFRKASGDLQAIDINLQYVENFTEHHAEMFLGLNPYDVELNGWIWTRIDLEKPIKLKKIVPDTKWHKFSISVEYGLKVVFKQITFDGSVFDINLEAGTNPKGWKDGFAILLETTNLYPNCSPLLAYKGSSQWRNIILTRKGIQ
jgi:hypothetical protein